MKTITSRQHPVVRLFRELARRPDPTGTRLLLDGAHLVREALASGVAIEMAAVAASSLDRNGEEGALANELAARGVEVVSASDSLFDALSPVRTPSGITAVGRRQPITAAQICSQPTPLLVLGVDVQDPGNVGAVVRVAEAAGATGALFAGSSANPFSWKALRGSMGSALRLPVAGGLDTDEALACLRQSRVRTIAAVARGGAEPDAIQWHGGVAIVVGSEGQGLHDHVVARCEEQVTIPMSARVESLNVAVAAAILLYAARRDRGGREA